MMRTHAFVLLAVLALIAAGCDAEDVSAPDIDTPAPSEEATQPSEDDGSGSEDSETEQPSDPEPQGSENSAFEEFFMAKTNAEWMVEYTLTSSGIPGAMDGVEMTQYMQGENRLRTDVIVQNIESRTYIIDGQITSCTRLDSEWMCFGTDIEADTQTEVEAQIEEGDYTATPSGSRTIAGVSATCFTFSTEDGASGEYCFSPESVPLLIEVEAEGISMELLATSYSLSVPAGTWDVPESTGFPGGFDPSDWI